MQVAHTCTAYCTTLSDCLLECRPVYNTKILNINYTFTNHKTSTQQAMHHNLQKL